MYAVVKPWVPRKLVCVALLTFYHVPHVPRLWSQSFAGEVGGWQKGLAHGVCLKHYSVEGTGREQDDLRLHCDVLLFVCCDTRFDQVTRPAYKLFSCLGWGWGQVMCVGGGEGVLCKTTSRQAFEGPRRDCTASA